MDSNIAQPQPSVSPRKMQKPKSPRTKFQLYNPSHKSDLIKLLQGAKPFKITDIDGTREEDEDLKDVSDTEYPELPEDEAPHSSDTMILNLSLSEGSGLTCTTCEVSFTDAQEQRLHFHLDWHRYNVKRRIHGQRPVNDVQFDEMMDGLSSISGSDNDESESAVPEVQVSRLLNKVGEDDGTNDIIKEQSKDSKESKAVKKLIGSPKTFFENARGEFLAIYKASLPNVSSTDNIKSKIDVDLSQFLTNPPKWAIILVSSGHFAGSVFQGGKEIIHKTFHSYTVRAKQGGAESSSGMHKSAGSNLRRHNEASLFLNIQDVLESWKSHLDSCQTIFYRMGSANQSVLFGGKNPPLQKSDPRIRTIPFPTKRPTFSEVKNVLAHLTSIQIYSKELFLAQFVTIKKEQPPGTEDLTKAKTRSKSKKANKIDRCRSRSPPSREVPGKFPSSSEESSGNEDVGGLIEMDQEIDFSELQEFGDSLTPEERQRKLPKRRKPRKPKVEFQKPGGLTGELLELLKGDDSVFVGRLVDEFRKATDLGLIDNLLVELNQPVDEENSTLLHVAARTAKNDIIWCLLEHGLEPSLKDKLGKYAYNCAETKECRNLFRRFRAEYPDKYDYQKSQIPGPLTEEMEQEKAEKKRILNKLKREKEKQKKMERKEKQDEIDEQQRFLNLSDREKRALAAEKRRLQECKHSSEKAPILVRCFECAVDMTGKIPFEYNRNVFCTTKCLAVHRKKFPTPLSV